ncbi:MAG TPA: hypothetical protein VGC66_17165 [Pyrinomonadaceae bacterium]|jgi:hypothetical protein
MKLVLVLVTATLLMLAPEADAQTRTRIRNIGIDRPTQAQAATRQLPLRRVILYSNGVAYFERRGTIRGRAEIDLQFKQSQVDDVLKSMVVLDLGRGQIGAVSYNSSAPPSARLADIPFSIEAGTEDSTQGGLAGVLRQLQGARVVVTTAGRSATGAILTIEERQSQKDADKPSVTMRAIVIASETGEISSFDLAEVRSVRLVDEGARRDVTAFASASASARRRDAKTIVITSDGAGEREMVVSYTIAAPIWKTTYRVVLDSSGKPFFQGWAIVDNVGDEDWTDVSLSLVSGTPVSFIQPLQQPLYRYRPVIPIPDDLNLDPQIYDPSIGRGRGYNSGGGGGIGGGGGGAGGGGGGGDDPTRVYTSKAVTGGPVTTLSDAITSEDSGIKTAATGKESGDLFEYLIDRPVTVARDRSALIPILQTRMEGERVSIYTEAAQKDRPMSGMLLKNTSQLTLEGGALTVIDSNAYAGEALMERLKPNEERFISFAVDLATLVTVRKEEGREPVFLVRVLNGTFQAHYYQSEKKSYTITNQTDRPRIVYVEHPWREGWRLSDESPKPVEKTASAYRFRIELAPRQSVELMIAERRALMDSYALSNLTPRDLELFVSRRYLDEASRVALEKIINLKSRIAEVAARVEAVDREASEIGADQARLRENIKALGQTTEARQLIARYVAKAGEQETRIEQLTSARRAAAQERVQLQAELEAAIHALALDRKL